MLTGNPDNDEYAKALLEGFNATAKKMKLETPPTLFLYTWDSGFMAETNAFSYKLDDGTYIMGISTALTNLFRFHSVDMNTLIKRLIAVSGRLPGTPLKVSDSRPS